ncbi:MAG: penicillin-binding protein 1A [Glaciecola sp.]|jgi:penicillin-binding protein 1A
MSRSLTRLLALVALLATACGQMVTLQAGDIVAFVQQPQTSVVLAADGTVLAELHGEQDRIKIPLEEMSDLLVSAVVSIEDRRFFLHAGIDLAAIARATMANIDGGRIEQGGSTITQQYIKNVVTGPAQTIERKLQEAALAWQLEQTHSKQQILERYLNTVYFGAGAYGVSAAAKRFFDQGPAELSLAQAAQLAGSIASPSKFDPYQHPQAAQARRGLVLDAMLDTGRITTRQADAAREVDLELVDRTTVDDAVAPYFVAEVKRLIQHDPDGVFGRLGDTLDDRVNALFTGGLRIQSTLDPTMQTQAEQAVRGVLTQREDPYAALVAIDPLTGEVKAMVGGRDYNDVSDPFARFNLATQGSRQPGSSFKPIVLATALSGGVSLDRTFPGGSCVNFRVVAWNPCNYGDIDYGPLSLREATVRSANTVYARLAVEVGANRIVEQAHALGIDSELAAVPAIGLGVAEVAPFEMAEAFTSFATLGEHHPAHLISSITAPDGEVLFAQDTRGRRVLDEAVAWLVTQTLQDVVRRGTGLRASLARPQAGKTGTAQNNADAWFVGYTPDLVTAVWVGFPQGQISMVPPRTRQVVEGGRWPAEIWKAFNQEALKGLPARPFLAPDVSLITIEVDGSRDCLPNANTPPSLVELRQYMIGAEPRQVCTEPAGPPIDNVPNVVGFPLEVAQRILRDGGFLIEVRPEASDLYPTGVVSHQRPGLDGRTLAKDGNAVVLWVSSVVRARSRVPSALELPVDTAIENLESAGWVVEVTSSCPPDGCGSLPAERVWAQLPAPGALARDFSVIRLTVPTP